MKENIKKQQIILYYRIGLKNDFIFKAQNSCWALIDRVFWILLLKTKWAVYTIFRQWLIKYIISGYIFLNTVRKEGGRSDALCRHKLKIQGSVF